MTRPYARHAAPCGSRVAFCHPERSNAESRSLPCACRRDRAIDRKRVLFVAGFLHCAFARGKAPVEMTIMPQIVPEWDIFVGVLSKRPGCGKLHGSMAAGAARASHTIQSTDD